MSTTKKKYIIAQIIMTILAVSGFSYAAYVGYVAYTAWDLVGEKIYIDGKELTITASHQGECILSDRTRIHALYARKLLVGGNNGDDK